MRPEVGGSSANIPEGHIPVVGHPACGADNDVNGCASCDLCQTFHLHERAIGNRQSISLHGVRNRAVP